MQDFTLRQLRVFAAVAESENLAAASRDLRLSQATASEALKTLEGILGQTLFDRSNRRLRLNTAGRAFLKDVQLLLAQSAAMHRRHFGGERLLFGASVTVANYILPPIIVQLMRDIPKLQIELIIRNTEGIAQLLLDREIQAALVEGRVSHRELDTVVWRDDDLAVFSRPDHPLIEGATRESLCTERWILRERGSGTRESFDRAAESWPLPPTIVMTAGGNEIIKRAVIAGLGLGCLSLSAIDREVRRGDLAIIPVDFQLTRALTFVRRRDYFHDANLELLINSLGIDIAS
jgi:DNA-binding transcriptional LysR family regulator